MPFYTLHFNWGIMLTGGSKGQIPLQSLITLLFIRAHLDVSSLRSETVRAFSGIKHDGILSSQRQNRRERQCFSPCRLHFAGGKVDP